MCRPLALIFAVLVFVSCTDVKTEPMSTGRDPSPRAVAFTPDPTAGLVAAAHEQGLQRFYAAVYWQGVGRWVTALAAQETARKAAAATTARRVPRTGPQLSAPSSGRCGGDLPPCFVMMRESGGNLNAYNPTGCSGRGCRGKWQCDPRSCSGTGTEAQQDAEARALWDGGRGCANWDAC